MGELHVPGALERSVVLRKLNSSGRYSKFGMEDVIAPMLLYALLYLGSLALGYSSAYCYVGLAAALVGAWQLRLRFPEGGVLGLLRVYLAPRHLSAHARDRLLPPFPAAKPPSVPSHHAPARSRS